MCGQNTVNIGDNSINSKIISEDKMSENRNSLVSSLGFTTNIEGLE